MSSQTSSFTAELSHLPKMFHWVQKRLKETTFSLSDRHKIELSIEEVLINVVKHAYSKEDGTIEITIHCKDEKEIECIIKDSGSPFDPLNYPIHIDTESSLEKKEEGGLGILFMRKNMDEVIYQREGKYNILILRKFKKD